MSNPWTWGSSSYQGWSTKDEIELVKSIADKSNEFAREKFAGMPRVAILRQYLETMDLRARWDTIDPLKVRAFVTSEIALEVQKGR
jgi:hypothetical protein